MHKRRQLAVFPLHVQPSSWIHTTFTHSRNGHKKPYTHPQTIALLTQLCLKDFKALRAAGRVRTPECGKMPGRGLECRKRHVAWAVMTCSGITKACVCVRVCYSSPKDKTKQFKMGFHWGVFVCQSGRRYTKAAVTRFGESLGSLFGAQNLTALKQHRIVLKAFALEGRDRNRMKKESENRLRPSLSMAFPGERRLDQKIISACKCALKYNVRKRHRPMKNI